MKKEVKPAVFWVLIGVLAIVVLFVGLRMFSSSKPVADTTGSEATMKHVQETGKFYEPPAGAPVPGRTGAPGGGMPGGYIAPPPGR